MGVTVGELLQIDILKNASVIAGASGMNRQIRRVSFSDVPLEEWKDPTCFEPGDVFIRSFFADKDREERICEAISFYIQVNSACCITYRRFLPHFPENAIALANEHNYPIIVLDEIIPYANLIRMITEYILISQHEWLIENSLSLLLHHSPSAEKVSELYRKLVPAAYENFLVIYASLGACAPALIRSLADTLATQFPTTFLRYSKDCFILLSCPNPKNTAVTLQQIDSVLAAYAPDHIAGISNPCKEADFPKGLHQALDAHEVGKVTDSRITYYNELSVYKLLMPLCRKHGEELASFYDEVISPLKAYEENNSVNLLETVATYIECDGNIKKAASILHQHENTVRFRVGKARELLNLSHNHCAFIELVSIALRIGKLLSRDS